MGKYKRSRAGRAQKMRDIYNDPKTPREIKGWIKQELNSGRTFSRVRVPPGYELAHYHGFEAKKGFDYRFTSLQLESNHYTQHKYDNNGIRNKTPTNINIKTTKDIPSFRSRSECYNFFKKSDMSIKEIKPNIDIGRGNIRTNSIKIKAGKSLNRLSVGSDVLDISSKVIKGDINGALVMSSQVIGSYGGQYIGAAIGSLGGPIGALIGGYIGGMIGDYLGSLAGEALFGSCFNGAGLNENNGKTGGVEVRTITSLKPLKSNVFFIFSHINYVVIPLNSKIPDTIQNLLPGVEMNFIVHRIIYEIYYGIAVQKAPILFSLHFSKEGFLYPVIHPYYRNTLTGYILGLIDYFLKGFVNGGTYKPEFIIEWYKSKNMNSNYLRQILLIFVMSLKNQIYNQ